jgi:hypothetical protein
MHDSDQPLTGRAGQSALEIATPSSPGYDGGAHFRRYACQSCKKSAGIKVLVNNTIRDHRSSKQIISSKLFKTKNVKMTKCTAELAVAIDATVCMVWQRNRQRSLPQEAQATSQPIFKPKRPKSSSRGPVLWKDEETDSAGTSLGGF